MKYVANNIYKLSILFQKNKMKKQQSNDMVPSFTLVTEMTTVYILRSSVTYLRTIQAL